MDIQQRIKPTSQSQAMMSKNQTELCTLTVNRGISIDRGEKAWCTGRAVIDSYRKPLAECSPNELWKGQLDIELTQLDTLTQHLQTVVRQLEAIGKNDARIQRVRTIPGVGPRTAEILVACMMTPIASRMDDKYRPTSASFLANTNPVKPIATAA